MCQLLELSLPDANVVNPLSANSRKLKKVKHTQIIERIVSVCLTILCCWHVKDYVKGFTARSLKRRTDQIASTFKQVIRLPLHSQQKEGKFDSYRRNPSI